MSENSNEQIVLDCIKELSATHAAAKKAAILEKSCLSPHIVKEKLDKLLEDGLIKRLERGVYLPVQTFPPARPISRTLLSDGMAVVDVGDVVIHLTPQEESQLSKMYAGNAVVHIMSAPVIQSAPAPAQPLLVSRATAHGISIMTIDDIADTCMVGRRYARDNIIKRPDFPPQIPGCSRKKPMWLTSAVQAYFSQVSPIAA